IGGAVARRAQGFGLRLLAHDPYLDDVAVRVRGAQPRPLQALLEESDYVTLHAPLSPTTRHLIGLDQLAAMQPTAYLINTSRGGASSRPPPSTRRPGRPGGGPPAERAREGRAAGRGESPAARGAQGAGAAYFTSRASSAMAVPVAPAFFWPLGATTTVCGPPARPLLVKTACWTCVVALYRSTVAATPSTVILALPSCGPLAMTTVTAVPSKASVALAAVG